ncbi:hypothetical protein WR25_01642 [Diploscapter pachys]|uniref:LEM domain-containing protein n=1 Tax=Diploscapter pachys TaxID=2018661 RepID=A0A2A2JS92_9BILA|nr:hypothetical protein WR25_01642 [Diploscapter pachys]
MKDASALSDAELRSELISLTGDGSALPPITGTTRTMLEKKLVKLRKEKGTAAKQIKSKAASAATAPPSIRSTSRKTTSRKAPVSEEESDEDDESVVSKVVEVKRRPVTSTPNATPPASRQNSRSRGRPASTAKPFTTTSPVHVSPPKSSASSLFSIFSTSADRISSEGDVNSSLSTQHSPRRAPPTDMSPVFDQPGQTPPRKRMDNVAPWLSSTRNSASSVTSRTTSYGLADRKSSTKASEWKSPAGRSLLDLGQSSGGEESDGGLETSRVVYSSYKPPDNRSTGKTGKLANLWDSFLGNKFDAGKEPGSRYEMRHGATRTRVVRDPKTNKYSVQHDTIGQDWPQLLLYILCGFTLMLAAVYVCSAHPQHVQKAGRTITNGIRDAVQFFYQYAILPVIIVFGAVLTVFALYYGQKKWARMKEEEERAFFELVENITRMVYDSYIDGESYISQPHVRDLIFPPAKRRGAELARWERAAAFIDESESRIATESRMMPSGHECAVWRWTGGKRKL